MTAPHEPSDPTASELGSTAQFKAFVQHNDEPDEARERAAADPDGPRAATVAGSDAPFVADGDDREIQFAEPVQAGPPVQSPRPDADLPPGELGSTAQFKAFASSNGSEPAEGSAPRSASRHTEPRPSAAPRPAPPAPHDELEPPALPPADPSSKRTVLISLAVLLLVVVAVVLLFVLV